MRFETNFVKGQRYGDKPEEISLNISAAHLQAAQLGGRVVDHVVEGGIIYITSALPETMEEEARLKSTPFPPSSTV